MLIGCLLPRACLREYKNWRRRRNLPRTLLKMVVLYNACCRQRIVKEYFAHPGYSFNSVVIGHNGVYIYISLLEVLEKMGWNGDSGNCAYDFNQVYYSSAVMGCYILMDPRYYSWLYFWLLSTQ